MPDATTALLDARMDEIYCASFAFAEGRWTEVDAAHLLRPEAVALPASALAQAAAGNVFGVYGPRLTGLAEGVARRVLRESSDDRLVCRDAELRAALLDPMPQSWVRAARHAWIARHDADGDASAAVADHVADDDHLNAALAANFGIGFCTQ